MCSDVASQNRDATHSFHERFDMGFYERKGALIEVSVLSDGIDGSDDFIVEFWDLAVGGDGELLHVYFNADGVATVDCLSGAVDEDFVNWALEIARLELGKY
jgi:hypothetical protein